jgi:phospholipid/cholesterol/gamma-HCH transport system ATP-binding protein
MNAVSVTGLSHTFGNHPVLKDINVTVPDGQICYVLGSSGGGKTTFLKCLSGLIIPTKGAIEIAGINVRSQPEAARKQMGMVFQSAALFDYLTIEENVLFGLERHTEMSKSESQKWCVECLKKVGLDDRAAKLLPAELSGGMKKRAGIARAIALKPKVMLYDEPTTGLDPITTYTIDALIRNVSRDSGMTSIVVSHDINSTLRTADRVLFLSAGSIIFDDVPTEFLKSSQAAIEELVTKATATELSAA